MTRVRHVTRLVAIISFGMVIAICDASSQEREAASVKAFTNASQVYNSGQMAEALFAFQAFENKYKFSALIPQAVYLEGWCYANMQQYSNAVPTFDRLIQNYHQAKVIPEAILKEAECYRELGDFQKAADLCRAFQASYPQHELRPQAMLGEAWALFKL